MDMNGPEPSDEDLLARLLKGEEEAFTSLYRRRQSSVYRFALQMSGSEAMAEDVTQEVFLALLVDGKGYDPGRGTLAAYLYGIARNKVLRFLERQGPSALHEAHAEPASAERGPLEELAGKQSVQAVRLAILALPLHYREVVVLCELHEMSYEQAAEALGCAVGTVRSRLHRGRSLLEEKLRGASEAGLARGSISPARSWI